MLYLLLLINHILGRLMHNILLRLLLVYSYYLLICCMCIFLSSFSWGLGLFLVRWYLRLRQPLFLLVLYLLATSSAYLPSCPPQPHPQPSSHSPYPPSQTHPQTRQQPPSPSTCSLPPSKSSNTIQPQLSQSQHPLSQHSVYPVSTR